MALSVVQDSHTSSLYSIPSELRLTLTDMPVRCSNSIGSHSASKKYPLQQRQFVYCRLEKGDSWIDDTDKQQPAHESWDEATRRQN
jgi:hypothetical protein